MALGQELHFPLVFLRRVTRIEGDLKQDAWGTFYDVDGCGELGFKDILETHEKVLNCTSTICNSAERPRA